MIVPHEVGPKWVALVIDAPTLSAFYQRKARTEARVLYLPSGAPLMHDQLNGVLHHDFLVFCECAVGGEA